MNLSRYALLVLVLFACFCTLRHLNETGEDLASSYVGCKLLATDESSHLYSHDDEHFNEVSDPLWDDVAQRSGFSELDLLHPYVQTPLWAYLLRPACMRMSFPQFNKVFMAFAVLCFAGTLWLVARYWTPRLLHPGWIALIVCGLYLSQPFRYSLFLNQTQIIFVFLTVAALVLARRGHPVAAGVLLAVAAAVKITPGFLVVYWLLTRQMRAALSFIVSSALLVTVTIFTCGLGVMEAYLQNLTYISNVLLLAFNNQSFAAWLLGHRYPYENFVWEIYALPVAVKILCLLLTLAGTAVGGIWDRRLLRDHPDGESWQPLGAVLAMLAATMLAPIAWTHYFALLIVPVMLMLQANLRRRSPALIGLVLAIFALNLYPIASDAVLLHVTRFTVLRSQFYAGVLSLLGIGILYIRECRQVEAVSMASSQETITIT